MYTEGPLFNGPHRVTLRPAVSRLEVLERIQKTVPWLSTYMVHHANSIRPNPEGVKVGRPPGVVVVGRQPADRALLRRCVRSDDLWRVKAHASPAFYAVQYLARPSRRRGVRASCGASAGSRPIRAGARTPASSTSRPARWGSAPCRPPSERWRPGTSSTTSARGRPGASSSWSATPSSTRATSARRWPKRSSGGSANVLWIVDVNRQSLDRIVPDGRLRQMRAMFRAAGWHVIELALGPQASQKLFAKPGGEWLRTQLDAMSNVEYQRLLRLAPGGHRKALVTDREGRADRVLDRLLGNIGDAALGELVADRGGHDLRAILDAFEEAGRGPRPTGGHPRPHDQGLGLAVRGRPAQSHGAAHAGAQIDAAPCIARVSPRARSGTASRRAARRRRSCARSAALHAARAARLDAARFPPRSTRATPAECSTQEASGRVLGALSRLPVADAHRDGVGRRRGDHAPRGLDQSQGRLFPEAPDRIRSPISRRRCSGRSLRRASTSSSASRSTICSCCWRASVSRASCTGETLLPIGDALRPLRHPRARRACITRLYCGARFIVAATPSGVEPGRPRAAPTSRSSRRASASRCPAIVYSGSGVRAGDRVDPADALRRRAVRTEAALPAAQSTAHRRIRRLAPPPSAGAHRARRARAAPTGSSTRAASRVEPGDQRGQPLRRRRRWCPRRSHAARALRERAVLASVFVVTSPDRLLPGTARAAAVSRDARERRRGGRARGVRARRPLARARLHRRARSACPQTALGVDDFGQSGTRADLYRHYGIDAAAHRRRGADSARRGIIRIYRWRRSTPSANASSAASSRRSSGPARCSRTRTSCWCTSPTGLTLLPRARRLRRVPHVGRARRRRSSSSPTARSCRSSPAARARALGRMPAGRGRHRHLAHADEPRARGRLRQPDRRRRARAREPAPVVGGRPARLLLRARPVEPAGVHDRRQHRQQLRRPAHAQVRRHHQPRARASRSSCPTARSCGSAARRATRAATTWPASSWAPRAPFGIATKIVVRILKKPQAVKTVLAVFDEIDQRLRGGVGDHRARPRARGDGDDRPAHDPGGGGRVRLRLSARCRRGAPDRARRPRRRHGRAGRAHRRGVPGGRRARGARRRATRPSASSSGRAQVRVRRLRPHLARLHGDGRRHPAHEAAVRAPARERDRRGGTACASATCSTPATATSTRTSSTTRASRARRRAWWRPAREIMKVCAEVGGSISGEHGIGLEKADFMPFIFSAADLAFMQRAQERVQPDRALQSGQDLPDQEVLRRGRARRVPAAPDRRTGPRPALLSAGG
mgnify:CR=1 FL=1